MVIEHRKACMFRIPKYHVKIIMTDRYSKKFFLYFAIEFDIISETWLNLRSVFTNVPYVLLTISTLFIYYMVPGLYSQIAKYLVLKFEMDASLSSVYTGKPIIFLIPKAVHFLVPSIDYRRQDLCVAKIVLWILTSCTYWWENRYPYPLLLHVLLLYATCPPTP